MRETVTWLVIVAYAALAAGLPLPAGAVVASPRHLAAAAKAGLLAAKDRSRPFPCMDSPCGCATAEQCFRECCCHSVSERLDWARRNGLEAELLAVLEGRQNARTAAPGADTGGCCSAGETRAKKRRPSCCSGAAPAPADTCCEPSRVDESRIAREAICTAGGEAEVSLSEDRRGIPVVETPHEDDGPVIVAGPVEDGPAPRDVPRRRSVTLRALLACQGLVAEWVSVGGTLPPLRVEAGASAAPAGWVELHDAVALSPPRAPESPPPESV